jgi:hypothetical protein
MFEYPKFYDNKDWFGFLITKTGCLVTTLVEKEILCRFQLNPVEFHPVHYDHAK